MPLTLEQQVTGLVEDFTGYQSNLKAALDAQAAEIKAHGTSTGETAKKVDDLTSTLAEIGQTLKDVQARVHDVETKAARPRFGGEDAPKSLGERFVASEQYDAMVKASKDKSDIVEVGRIFSPRATLLTSDGASGGSLVESQRIAGIIAPPDRQLRLRDMLNVETTESNALEYVQETGFTNNAAERAENTAKPESALAFELKTANVQTIAHWLPATRQIISDASQLRAYIDNRLLFGLKLREDRQILYGNGTSPNLPGIMTNADVQTYVWSDGSVGDQKVDAIRRAVTLAQVAEYPPDTVVLHPTDWEDIELTKDSEGRYLWVMVPSGGEMRLWRMTVVVTTGINAGEFLVGSFGLAATLWDREQGNIRVADQHADYFIYNKVVVLAEERVALTVFRPEAFVAGEFDAAPEAP